METPLSAVQSVDKLRPTSATTSPAQGMGASVFAQDRQTWRQELLADLAAALTTQPSSNSRNGWFARPGILRRMAALIGQSAPIDADRIVAVGDFAEILGAAVALETGLPFCVVGPEGDAGSRVGVVHAGERVAVISVDLTAVALVESLPGRGIEVLNWRALVYGADDASLLSREPRFSAEFSETELNTVTQSEGK